MRLQDSTFSTVADVPDLCRSRASSISSVSTLSSINSDCPCCCDFLVAAVVPPVVSAIPPVAAVPPAVAAVLPAFAAAPPFFTAIPPAAIAVPTSTFTFHIPLPQTTRPFANVPIQDRTNTTGRPSPTVPGQRRKKQRRRTRKEGEPAHQTERVKRNPSARTTSQKERREAGRKKKAISQAIPTVADWARLDRSWVRELSGNAYTLDDIRSMGLKIVSWDGM